jgi:hypothetical protein
VGIHATVPNGNKDKGSLYAKILMAQKNKIGRDFQQSGNGM